MKISKAKKTGPLSFIIIVILLIVFIKGYSYWNSAGPEPIDGYGILTKANPDNTCGTCHEIGSSITKWQHSAHRNLQCAECHGTALSNGLHSLNEKMGMVFTHASGSPENEDLRMNEEQVLGIQERCVACHTSEGAKWAAGRHSTTYADIFLDQEHNKMEAPYWDCFRCHGMHYDGDINDLMIRPDALGGAWEMLQPEQANVHAITCMACHEMHSENEPVMEMNNVGLNQEPRRSAANLYIRTDKRHRNADGLQNVEMVDDKGKRIEVSDDPVYKLCIQCHSPNAYHEAGSEDDHTPTGVHEGLSCVACHDPHSNSAQNSCITCHTDVSTNCKLDVRFMNTTYFNAESENNVHNISCTSCHTNKS